MSANWHNAKQTTWEASAYFNHIRYPYAQRTLSLAEQLLDECQPPPLTDPGFRSFTMQIN